MNTYDTDQPLYSRLLACAYRLRSSGPSEELALIETIARMIEKGELQFTGRYKQLQRLKGMGMVAGVRVRDGAGAEGVVPDDSNIGWGAYSYHVTFRNDRGETVLMTNGIYDATIIG